ncbi:16485_t:CDS:1 [Cetraspora pellucida]|uniref:16485_t:CDS:1 n=1 Tax=Cetraspora pellucida TaxID=1433469 RepID=A0ACA9L6V9_9GLOM|nr:16485_t:CDS:1 [Cetraspora pellucida]
MPVVSVHIKAESIKVNWISVSVLKDITVEQFYKELIAEKIVFEVQLDNEDCLQPVKAEFSSNITGPFNVISIEYNIIKAIKAWRNRVQYYQTNSSTLLLPKVPINIFLQIMNNATSLNNLPTFIISEHLNILEKLQYDIVK